MGKKKRLANRLTKMSDEERARYLQHKADMEEETKRRKEQLISTFLKNKIKKEEGFARLNLAKINQYWHHLLRISKCDEMKKEVEHLKQYMKRVLDYKNRTIEKLLEEFKMAEQQYLHNFVNHVEHIDRTINQHKDYLSHLWSYYASDVDQIVTTTTQTQQENVHKLTANSEQLKTLIFIEDAETERKLDEIGDFFAKKRDELNCTFRLKIESLTKQQNRRASDVWQQIVTIIRSYIVRNDQRRLHLAELKRLDAESAVEIASNRENIDKLQVEIDCLTNEYRRIRQQGDQIVDLLTQNLEQSNNDFDKQRKQLRKYLEIDRKQLLELTRRSCDVLEFLLVIKQKTRHIYNLLRTCQQYETGNEKSTNWLVDIVERNTLGADKAVLSTDTVTEIQKVVITERIDDLGDGESFDGFVAFDFLMDFENFWLSYNRVAVEVDELRVEKRLLVEENKKIRGNIRAVIQAEILQQSLTNSRVSTRVASKVRSAPTGRFIF